MTTHFDFFTPATRTALAYMGACEEGLARFDASTGMEFPGRLVRRDVAWLIGRRASRQLLPPSTARDAADATRTYLDTLKFQ